MKSIHAILIGIVLAGQTAVAQRPLEIIINFPPPYPREIAAYYFAPEAYSVTIINYTENEQEIYLTGGVIGTDNGVVTAVKPTYRPQTSFIVPASGVRVIDGLELSEINDDLDSSDIILNGIPVTELNISGMLPEGNYVFCLTARDYLTGQPLSVGCSFEFNIYYADQTIITTPLEGEVIAEAPSPVFPVNWFLNLSDPLKYMDIGYEIKMIDLTEYPDEDVQQLFLDPAVPPVLELETTLNNYLYNGLGSDPELIPGHEYAVRVRSLDMANEIVIPNDGFSEVRRFWYGYNPNDGAGEDEDAALSECVQSCYYTGALRTQTASASSFERIAIGHFEIEQLVITHEGASGIYGTGVIPIPFLNDVKINVTFEGLRVNRDGRVYDGVAVSAEQDVNQISLSDIHHALFADRIEPAPSDIAAITEGIESSRTVFAMASGTPVNAPLGLREYIQGREFTLGITDFRFEADRASVNIVSFVDLDALGRNKWLALGGTDVCLTPGGFGGEYMLGQAIDLDFIGWGGHAYTLSGAYGSPEDVEAEGSFIQVDCDGLKKLAIRGEVAFNRDMLVPDLENGRIGSGKVRGSFAMVLDREVAPGESAYGDAGVDAPPGTHLLFGVDIEPFQVVGFRGWGYVAEEAWLDLSGADNPPALVFPEGYEGDGTNADPSIAAIWEGFYLKTLELRAPPNFMAGTRASAAVQNVIIDPNLTMDIDIAGLIDRRQGNLEGWGISLDTFRFRIVQNVLDDSRIAGTINTPVMGEDNYIHYAAQFDLNANDRYSMIAQVTPDEPVDIPLSLARAALCESSYIQLAIDGEDTELSTFLKGQLAIDVLAALPEDVDIPDVVPDMQVKLADFQIHYDHEDGFITEEMAGDGTGCAFGFGLALTESCGGEGLDFTQPLWEWDQPDLSGYGAQAGEESTPSPQETLEGFPISFDAITLGFSGNSVSIDFGMSVSLDAAIEGFGISTNLGLVSDLNTTQNGLKRFLPDRLTFNCGAVQGLAIEPFVFSGEVCLTENEDGTRGFYGGLEVGLGPINVAMNGAFGRSGRPEDGVFGSPGYYGYWLVDGMVRMSPGIPLSAVPPIFFNGLGGGFYYNVITPDISPMAYSAINPEASGDLPEVSDLYATPPAPVYGSRSIRLRSSMSLVADQYMIADPYIQATFSTDHGLSALGFGGEFWMLSPTYNMRHLARLWGDLDNTLEFIPFGDGTRTVLSGDLELFANFIDMPSVKLYGAGANKKLLDFAWVVADEDVYSHDSNGDADNIFWQFNAGNPYADNMPGILMDIPGFGVDTDGDDKADIGISASAGAAGYFMIGQDIPGYLPDPPDALLGLGASKATEEGTFNGGGLRNNDTRPSIAAGTGDGIVMGMHAWASCSINAVFYASFSLFAGADLLLMNADNVSCYSSTGEWIENPGMMGWYGLGQAYAGMEGTIGAKGKLFGKEIDVKIMSLTAAMMLQAGGPDPLWLDGRAALTYNLLGGTIKGTAQMSISVGDKCVPPRTSPFDFPVILDTYPNAGDTKKIDPFLSPSATFTLPLDEVIRVPDVNGETHELKPFLKEFTLVPLDAHSNNGAQDDRYPQLSDDGYTAVYNPEKPLTGTGPDAGKGRNWRFRVVVAADERDPVTGAWRPVRLDNKIWEEVVEVEFKTSKLPDSIPSDLIPKTVPFVNQEFFLAEEITALSPGRIMTLDDLSADYFYAEKNDVEYEYEAVFRRASDNEEAGRMPASYVNYQAVYGIPPLDANRKYLVQLIRKSVRTGPTGQLPIAANTMRVVHAGSYTELLADSMSFDYAVESPAPEIDPQFLVEPGETLLYSYYFHTSAFTNLADKLDGVDVTVENKDGFDKVKFTGFEGFDTYDIEGLTTTDAFGQVDPFYSSDPLVEIEDLFTSAFHTNLTKPLIGQTYALYAADYAGENNGTYIEGPEIDEDPGFIGGTGGNFYVGQTLSLNGLAYGGTMPGFLELASPYGFTLAPFGLSVCNKFPAAPWLNYAWNNYATLTEWLNDNVTKGIVEPGSGGGQPLVIGGSNIFNPAIPINGGAPTDGSLTIKYYVTEYCLQDAEALADHLERALDGADETPSDECTDMSAYSWSNYLNVLENAHTTLVNSSLVNGFSVGGYSNSIRFRANKSYLWNSRIPGTSFTRTFTTNSPIQGNMGIND